MARSRVKRRRRVRYRAASRRIEWFPMTAFIGVTGGLLLAYLGAEMALSARIHPVHWAVAGGGGVLGYLVGMAWYWFRGDVL